MRQDVATDAARSNRAPIPFESDAPFLKIQGELPRELNGTLYRNGPNPQFDAPGAHWFVGDGMLHAFHLENGRASYRNRWVRTSKWQAEHDAGRALFGGFGRKMPDAPASTAGDSGVANTNIVFHAGRLLALEEGHAPVEIEPGTLAARTYRLTFDTGAYFRDGGRPIFYPRVEVTFAVQQPAEHHHIPLLLSPFGYSTYRGS